MSVAGYMKNKNVRSLRQMTEARELAMLRVLNGKKRLFVLHVFRATMDIK